MFMKNPFSIIFFVLLFANIASAQELDSMKYFVERFSDNTLNAEERRAAGLKIRAFQKARYLKSKTEPGADSLLLLEKQAAAGFVQINLATERLYSMLSDTSLENAVRWKALNALAQINTYQADSILVANIDDFNYLDDHPGGAGGEIRWMYPCFSLLDQKAAFNYALLKPVFDNLSTAKTENELYFIQQLLLDIFSDERLVQVWAEAMLARTDDPVVAKNFESLKRIKK